MLITDPTPASEKQSNTRYEMCKACDNFTPLKTCTKCSCFMPVKVHLAQAECPIGKWNKIP